jgi:hypothetical protein
MYRCAVEREDTARDPSAGCNVAALRACGVGIVGCIPARQVDRESEVTMPGWLKGWQALDLG